MVVEINRVRVLSRPAQLYTTHCAGCRREVELVTFNEAARLVGSNIDNIIRRAAKGELHLGLVPEAMLVCLDSLTKTAQHRALTTH